MKRIKLLLMVLLFANLTLSAQQNDSEIIESLPATQSSKAMKVLGNISVVATAASPSVNFSEMSNATLKKSSSFSVGELSINYKINPRFSAGLGTMGSLGLCNSGYYNAENNFVPFSYEDDGDEEEDDDEQDEDGDNDPEDEDDDSEDNDEDACGECGDNLMGSVTFKLSEKIPFFVQAAGGYSFGSNAPAYSAMIGYNQQIFKGLGIIGGIRFSDVLHTKPADAVSMAPSSSIRAELGLSWNF